jgi:hypothetical protein
MPPARRHLRPRGKSGRRDSNPRPSPWQGDALPTELLPPARADNLARPPTSYKHPPSRFEPQRRRRSGRGSPQLSPPQLASPRTRTSTRGNPPPTVNILAKSSSLGGIARLGLVTYRCIRVSSPGKWEKGEETTNGMPSVGDRVYPRGVAGPGLRPRGSQGGDTIGG